MRHHLDLSYHEIGAAGHVISQELSACIRCVHDPFADKIAERLGRAAAERALACPAIETRGRKIIGETESAVQLDRLAIFGLGMGLNGMLAAILLPLVWKLPVF